MLCRELTGVPLGLSYPVYNSVLPVLDYGSLAQHQEITEKPFGGLFWYFSGFRVLKTLSHAVWVLFFRFEHDCVRFLTIEK